MRSQRDTGAPYRLRTRRQAMGLMARGAAAVGVSAGVAACASRPARKEYRTMSTGLLRDPVCLLHEPSPGHPESPSRLEAIYDALARSGLLDQLDDTQPEPADDGRLALAHHPAYLDLVQREIARGAHQLSTGDTEVNASSLHAARAAAGAAVDAARRVCEGTWKNAFCAIRPPGHHATRNRAMGFCIANHAAIAARYVQARHGVERVLIIDWDVHHGNGTQDIFWEDGTVFYFSTHQHPWYPGTGLAEERGAGDGEGTTLNCPLPAGSGRREIFGCIEHQLLPALESFRPQFIVLSAGFDSRIHDPLGDFTLEDEDFADLTRLTLGLADHYAEGRLISVLEGGYRLAGLASAVEAHVRALMEG